MGLDKPNTLLPVDIFRSICEGKTELSNYSIPKHLLCLEQGKEIVLRALSFENEISLFLRLEPKDNGQPVILENLGTYRIGEDMHKILHSLFSRLCIYTFLGVTQENINAVLKRGKKKKEKEIGEKENKLLSLEFNPEIRKSSFETAFNILFIAVCYSGLTKQDNGYKYLKDKMKELKSKMLKEIGKEAAQSLIISLANKCNQIRSEYKNFEMDGLTISYSSVISEPINCYCTRLAMDDKRARWDADKNLEDEMNRQLLHCELGFDSVVKNNRDHIEVKHTISSLHYKPIQLKSFTNGRVNTISQLYNERYFPAKIRIKIRPEGDFELISHLMGESTPDPSVTVTTTTSSERGLAVEVSTGAASLTMGCKYGCSTARTSTRTCWKRKRDKEDPGVVRQDWILEDKISGVSAFDYRPYSPSKAAYRALVGLAGSDGPFTESGGISFEGEERCGPPMTWKFKRPPSKWAVEVEIGVAYYGHRYMEVRSKSSVAFPWCSPLNNRCRRWCGCLLFLFF